MHSIEEVEVCSVNIKWSTDDHWAKYEKSLELFYSHTANCGIFSQKWVHYRACGYYFDSIIFEDFVKSSCIMVSMAVWYYDRTNRNTWYTHRFNMKTGERWRVYHNSSTVNPKNIATRRAFRIEAMRLILSNFYTHPSTVTPKSGGVNVEVLSSSN